MKILFVEDNTFAQTLIAEVFGGEFNIEIAGDFVTAMENLNQVQFDLVVTDIFFPQETGTGKKELAGELAERLRIFCLKKGVNDFFRMLDGNAVVKKFIKENPEKAEYAFKQVEIMGRQLNNIPKGQRKAIEGIISWISSQDEEEQPLGILIAEECERRSLKFRMASSLFHHNDKLEAVNQFVSSRGWPDIVDYGHKSSSGEELKNPKEHRIFWEELRKEVMKKSA